MQGRLAIEMAVRALEGRLEVRHAGPKIAIVTPDQGSSAIIESSLAPASFVPVFSLPAESGTASGNCDGSPVGMHPMAVQAWC
jgi:hypothetical protein